MKRLFAILFLFSYSISSYGIGISYFYCCGKLKSISLSTSIREKNCGNTLSNGCCENKFVSFKLKADQKPGIPCGPDFSKNIVAVNAGLNAGESLNTVGVNAINISFSSPPVHWLSSTQRFLCVFRL